MDKQSRLLDKEYLKIRLMELKEVRRKEIKFEFHDSNRYNSLSLYIEFHTPNKDNVWMKTHELRISDHIADTPHTQFIIKPNDDLTKKKKEQFMKCLQLCVKKAQEKEMYIKMSKI